jgi:tricorn protease
MQAGGEGSFAGTTSTNEAGEKFVAPRSQAPAEAKEQEANKKSETSDKAKPEEKKDDAKPTDAVKVVIDLAGIGQRILAMPIPAANLGNLKTADGGKLFYVTYAQNGSPILNRFDLKERKSEVFMAGVGGYEISADGKKVLYLGGGSNIGIVDASGKPNVGDGKLNVSTLQAQIDPRNEWKEMIDDFWRIERDYFYVPNMHGANWNEVKKKYAVFIPHLSSRGDVNFLISEISAGPADFPRL